MPKKIDPINLKPDDKRAAEDLARAQLSAHQSQQEQSLMDKFRHEHREHPNKEQAWHDYYQSLSDVEKYQIWKEFEESQEVGVEKHVVSKPIPQNASVAEAKKSILANMKKRPNMETKHRLKPLMTGVLVALLVLLINYNEMVVAQVKQYISPGSSQGSPVIIDPNAKVNVGNDPRIIIPKINVDVPVVYNVKGYDESKIQSALERGVVHYGSTPVPGQPGNNVIVGHSSNNFFNSGKYKFAFVLLNEMEKGDTFILHYKGTRYIYRVFNKKIIDPSDFSLIKPTATPTTTLITCTPPGTSWRRLVVQGEQISPSPTREEPEELKPPTDDDAEIVPGNAPSLLQSIRNFFSG